MTIRTKLFAGYLSLIIIFAASFFVNKRLSDQVSRNSAYLNKSEAVIRNSNVLHKLILDMQSGYRGFLLTGQDAFLDSYKRALDQLPAVSAEMRPLVNSSIQHQRLDSILDLNHAWVEYANELIAVRNDTLPASVKVFKKLFETKVKAYVGKNLNDRIREVFVKFDEHEYLVRQQRRTALEGSIRRTERINLGLAVFLIALAFLLSWYLTNMITRRIADMVNLAEKISQGEFRRMNDRHPDELHRLSESLNRMSGTLEKNFNDLRQKNKDLDDFAYVVSHDLKAPLRGIDNIITWTEEDHSDQLQPEIRKSIDLIKGRTRRLENMINGLLAYARIGKGKKQVELVEVGDLIADLAEMLVPPHVKISWDTLPAITTNRLQLEQVFSNLISNAVKYNDKEMPEVHISCRDLGDMYEFSVSDNGIGIQEQYFEKIFQIFQTLRERDAFESTGVGLAIVKRIVEEQNGQVTVKSETGKGSVFAFTWHKI
jgi:signal transduction histidine kinase